MNRILDSALVSEDTYKLLRPESIAGAKRVDLRHILDILNQRAILLLRKCADPTLQDRQTQLHRGQLAEVQTLYQALKKHEDQF